MIENSPNDNYEHDDPEADFYTRWMDAIELNGCVTRQELQEIVVDLALYPSGVGSIVRKVCENHYLAPEDAVFLIDIVSNSPFCVDQVGANIILNDENRTWLQKFEAVSVLNARWAVYELLNFIEERDGEAAREIIEHSKWKKDYRRTLDEVLFLKYGLKRRNWKN